MLRQLTTGAGLVWAAGAACRCHITCAVWGMTHHQSPPSTLPHHKLIAYQVAIEFATALGALRITDARIREQARKSTIGCVLNIAEGAGRRSRADKSRVYAIALGELCEAAAAVELAVALRACNGAEARPILHLAVRLKDLLSRLIK